MPPVIFTLLLVIILTANNRDVSVKSKDEPDNDIRNVNSINIVMFSKWYNTL